MRFDRRRATITGALAGATLAAAGWEVQRRIDARRIAADPERPGLEEPLAGRAAKVVSPDATRLHTEEFGPDGAPTIVLVHGWLCSRDFWRSQIRELSSEFRVVVYDQRGHGSSADPGPAGYTTEALADDLDAVLRARVPRGEHCILAGHSMGAMTVVAWAGRNRDTVRDRVAAAALVDTGMGDLVRQTLVFRPRWGARLHAAITAPLMGAPLRLPRSSTPVGYRIVRYMTCGKAASPAQVAYCERMVLDCEAPVRAGFGRMLSGLDLYESVAALDVPVVLVVGSSDRLTPPWHARRLAGALPQVVELVELPDVGHMAPVEAPHEVSERIRAIAREHLSDASPTHAAATARGR